jgi:hypothetical protein
VEVYVIGIAYQYLGQPANAYLVLKPRAPELSLGVAADTGRKKRELCDEINAKSAAAKAEP